MCLIIPHGESIRIAEKNITVYKRVNKEKKFWTPVCRNGEFKYNEVCTALSCTIPMKHLISISKWPLEIIEAGFHSFTIGGPGQFFLCPNVICIIPKGAEYCIGNRGDVVSTKLIVFKNILDYLWYKLWYR